MSDDSLWDEQRTERYLRLYKDPRLTQGSQSLLCKHAASFIQGDTVLDFGCGMGHIIPYIKNPESYVGLDYSKQMLTYLENFFPEIRTIHADATEPVIKLVKTLESQQLYPIMARFDTTISTSLIIHLPTVKMIKSLLQNMWELSEKTMIFGVETASNKKIVREDKLTLRNISVENIEAILKEIGIPTKAIHHTHQKITYQQFHSIFPLEGEPLRMEPPSLFTRTTLFIIEKEV